MLLSKLGSPRKYWIFTLLWATYFLCYCVRKPISIYKYYIESEYHLSKFELAWVDVALLLPYSCVQIFASSFWDQFRCSINLKQKYPISGLPFSFADQAL